jgi:lipid-A-disaccharide synthase
MAQKQILIICGEASGELHAANLTQGIKKINPDIRIFGVGSASLESAGAQIIYDIKGLSVFGLFDVIRKLPKFLALKKLALEKIRREKLDCIIFVDFSGFNLRLAKAINNSIATIYYVSPQVWASRKGRVKTIKKYIKKMIVLFKF